MLDVALFNAFIGKANKAHQQLCVWFSANNEFAKHQARWNGIDSRVEKYPDIRGCKYKNFWSVVVATLQHGWVLGTARLFDPAYHPWDKSKERPRISMDYILIKLDDAALSNKIRKELESHRPVIESIKENRRNWLAHNDASFSPIRIEAGIENLFQWLEDKIAEIKQAQPHLSGCGVINVQHNEKLSQCGVDEVFSTLLLGEKNEQTSGVRHL